MIISKILFVVGIVLTWAGATVIYRAYPMEYVFGIILEVVGYVMIGAAVLLYEKMKE